MILLTIDLSLRAKKLLEDWKKKADRSKENDWAMEQAWYLEGKFYLNGELTSEHPNYNLFKQHESYLKRKEYLNTPEHTLESIMPRYYNYKQQQTNKLYNPELDYQTHTEPFENSFKSILPKEPPKNTMSAYDPAKDPEGLTEDPDDYDLNF